MGFLSGKRLMAFSGFFISFSRLSSFFLCLFGFFFPGQARTIRSHGVRAFVCPEAF